MAVTTEDNRTAELTTDGVETEFDFPLLIHDDSEVQVWYEVTGGEYVQLVLDTNYTVVFTEDGGTVTTTGPDSPYAAGKILIIRHISLTQQTNWLYNDNHSEQQHQDDFDRSAMRDIQMQDTLDRVVTLAIHSSTTGIVLPEPNANYLLGWNAGGTNLANISIEAVAVLVSEEIELGDVPAALTDLTDVTIAGEVAGHILRYDGAQWTNYADSNYQASDATLTSIALLGTAANKMIYTTGVDTWAETALTVFARSILDDADEATFKATVNLEIGTDVLAQQDIGILDDNLLEVDGGPNLGEYARFTLYGLEGRTVAELGADGILLADGSVPLTGYLDITEAAVPGTPAANVMRIYAESIQGFPYLSFKDDGGMVRRFVRDSVILVYNDSGSTIAANKIVYASGSTSDVPTIALAKADAAATMPAIGVTIESIADDAFGRVMQIGLLENINTLAYDAGDVFYVSAATAGIPTTTPPSWPNLRQEIGTVLADSATVGSIQIVARATFNDALIDHSGLLGLTTGDDHPQYLEIDGSDDMTGGLTITGSADEIQLKVTGNATQTSDLVVVEKSDGTDIFRIEGTGEVDIIHTATSNDDYSLEVYTDAAGFGDIKAVDLDYITGAISAGEDEAVILVNIDEILSTGGDVFGFEVLATEGSAGVYGIKAGVGVGPIHQDSGVFANPTTGTDNTVSTDVPAMIDGSTGTTTAIFENDNEYIIIGAAAAFEELEIILTTGASGAGIAPTFAYSTAGAHQFTTFSPVDGTNGFRNTGVIAWDASDLTGHTTNDDTGTYDIKITRTRNNLGTTPVLGYAKTAATTEYIWDKDGDVNIKDLTASGTLSAEQLTSTDDATITDLITAARFQDSSLVAFYQFGQDADDSSKYGTNGTLAGGATVTNGVYVGDGVNGTQMTFAGTNMSGTYGSLVMWVNTDTIAAGVDYAFSCNSGGDNRIYFRRNAASFEYFWGDATAYDTSDDFVAGEWAHIAMTWNDGTIIAYWNGEQTDTQALSALTAPTTCFVGALLNSTAAWDGRIDNVRVYSRTLAAWEIREIYNNEQKIYGHFNDLTVEDDLTVGGTVTAEQLTSTDDLTVDDDASIGGDLAITGSITSAQNITVADLVSTDRIIATGIVSIVDGSLYLPLKTTTGDPTGVESRIYVNTFDNKIRVYADGAWRDLATW